MATIDHILSELRRQRHDLDRLLDDTNTSSLTTQELLARIEELKERAARVRAITPAELRASE